MWHCQEKPVLTAWVTFMAENNHFKQLWSPHRAEDSQFQEPWWPHCHTLTQPGAASPCSQGYFKELGTARKINQAHFSCQHQVPALTSTSRRMGMGVLNRMSILCNSNNGDWDEWDTVDFQLSDVQDTCLVYPRDECSILQATTLR